MIVINSSLNEFLWFINDQDSPKNNNPIIDYLDFEDGLEQAIAAVFSDELIASIDEEQSIFWRKLDVEDSSFNSEITKFSSLIKAPDNLKKKFRQGGKKLPPLFFLN